MRTRIHVVAMVGAAAVAVAGFTPATAAQVGQQTVSLVLRAPHPAALNRLAAARGLTRAQRLARLGRLLPGQAAHDQVAQALAREGLRVVRETAWTVTATGPAGVVSAVFGSRPALPAHPSAAQVAAATGALPRLPAALRALTAAALPTTGGPPAWHPLAAQSLSGSDFRNAYDAPSVPTPYSGRDSNGLLTIATVQFSTWNPSDLTHYAASIGLPDPVASKQYQTRLVDGGTTDSSGDIEVDLDQESILATAPHAYQTAYIAPNTDAGADDAFAAILDDVTGDSHATLPNPHIAAVSTSWGECESMQGATSINAEEPILESLVAAGVTVFAASGDDGIYDCGANPLPTTTADVDFPASSPAVVGVGGTNLQSVGSSAPNTGSNWTETAWSCTDPVSCESSAGTGGSGGGESGEAASGSGGFAGFSAPSYQQQYVTDTPFAGAPKRLVPDIAADGDPATGFDIYTSDQSYVLQCGGNTCTVGGTSLAAPVATSLFVNTLANFGLTAGVGDIHQAIYAAAGDPGSVRDITSGSNGSASDKGADPSVTAQTGYDTTSGVGAVLWPALAARLITTPPTVTAGLGLSDRTSPTDHNTLTAAWSVGETSTGAAPKSAAVTVTAVGAPSPTVNQPNDSPTGQLRFTGVPGTTYVLQVIGTDSVGNTATATTKAAVPIDDHAFTFNGRWHQETAANAYAGSLSVSSRRDASASVRATGSAFAVDAVAGPTAGKMRVFIDGQLARTVNLYASRVTPRRILLLVGSTIARHAFRFQVTGTKSRRSAGTAVALDDLIAAA